MRSGKSKVIDLLNWPRGRALLQALEFGNKAQRCSRQRRYQCNLRWICIILRCSRSRRHELQKKFWSPRTENLRAAFLKAPWGRRSHYWSDMRKFKMWSTKLNLTAICSINRISGKRTLRSEVNDGINPISEKMSLNNRHLPRSPTLQSSVLEVKAELLPIALEPTPECPVGMPASPELLKVPLSSIHRPCT